MSDCRCGHPADRHLSIATRAPHCIDCRVKHNYRWATWVSACPLAREEVEAESGASDE